jgi:hypothetical protein
MADELVELREEWRGLNENTIDSFQRLPLSALVATIRHLSGELLKRTEKYPPGEIPHPPAPLVTTPILDALNEGRHIEHPPWPAEGHYWSGWMLNKGLPNASYYRMCFHPDCPVIETKPAPII